MKLRFTTENFNFIICRVNGRIPICLNLRIRAQSLLRTIKHRIPERSARKLISRLKTRLLIHWKKISVRSLIL